MKKLAILFSVLFAVSIIGFGISIPFFGILDEEAMMSYSGGSGDKEKIETIDESFDNLSVSVVSSAVNIKKSDDGKTHIEYKNSRPNTKLYTKMDNGSLMIEERVSGFSFFFFSFGAHSELSIEIPEREFNDFIFNTVSGGADISNVECEKMKVNTTSGDLKISAFANTIELNTVSGKVEVENPTEKAIQALSSNATSGDVSIRGYETDNFKVSSISGNTTLDGISGNGDLNITSGNVSLFYKNWTDDLKISAVSGDVDVVLPENSGIEVKFDGLSGSVISKLGGNRISCAKGDTTVLGGENRHRISVSLTSGQVQISE